MIVIYKAEDGTEFESYEECEIYENMLTHPGLFNIIFFDENNQEYKITKENTYDEKIYYHSEKINIHNKDELAGFNWWADYCGYTEFYEINAPGIWVRKVDDMMNGYWIKVAAG